VFERETRWVAACAIGVSVVWFALLGVRPLFDPDEGRYAEIPREMLAHGDWVIPHLNGLVYLEKPPLQYWLTALCLAGGGDGEAAARFVTGLAGFVALCLTIALARCLWGAAAGLRAGLLALGSVLFVLLGHQLTLDMLLTVCLLSGLACFILAQRRLDDDRVCRAWMHGCWAAIALAVLAKGLIGIVIPGATLVGYTLMQRHTSVWRRLYWRSGLPLCLLIAATWFLLAARENPEFLRFFFVREHFQRFLTPIEQRSQPPWFFVPVLIVAVLPWITQAFAQLAWGWRTGVERGRFDVKRLLWVWSVFVLGFFSLSNAKLIPYILPAIPTLALLCAAPREPRTHARAGTDAGARALQGARADEGAAAWHFQAGAGLSLCFAAGVLVYASAVFGSSESHSLVRVLRPALWATSSVLVVGSAVCLGYTRRGRSLAALAALSAAWFGATLTVTAGAIRAEGFFSAKDVAAAIIRDEALTPDAGDAIAPAPVYTVQTYAQSLPFYLRQEVVLVDYRDEFDLGLRLAPERGLARVADFAALWPQLRSGYAMLPEATLLRLKDAELPYREVARFANRIVLIARR